ncbi:DUF3500 domain-containing protein [Streptomyces sp. NPDC001220]
MISAANAFLQAVAITSAAKTNESMKADAFSDSVRVHSPVVWVEVDCQAPGPLRGAYGGTPGVPTQMHVQSVIRTPNGNDYGKELTRRHCLTSPHHR